MMQANGQRNKGRLGLCMVERASTEQRPVPTGDWVGSLESQSHVGTGEPLKALISK